LLYNLTYESDSLPIEIIKLIYKAGTFMSTIKKTLGNLFLDKCRENPNANAIGWIDNDHIKYLSNSEYEEYVSKISLALSSIGVKEKESVAILSFTNKEWHLCDLGILTLGAIVIPVYPTYLSEEVEYILNHSQSKVIILENIEQFKKIIEIQDKLPNLTNVISLTDISPEETSKLKTTIAFHNFDDFLNIDKSSHNISTFENNIKKINEEDIASIIYTSGTTGEPKGAVITHKAFYTMLNNIKETLGQNIDHSDRTLTFLPLSHVLGRCDSFLNLSLGLENVYAESIEKIIDNLSIVKPTIMIAVPRIFEKVYSKIMDTVEDGSYIKTKLFRWAVNVSNEYYSYIEKDKAPPSQLQLQRNLAYKIVFSKIYKRFGGRIRFFVSGGAPLATEIISFLRNANLSILEGYGLTETIAPCIVNPISKQIIGTVGLPIGDVQLKIAKDGEILIKTEAMLTEYYKNPEATAETINEDGWLHSGDIGIITEDGYLKITDRKKDIIITSGGKNVAPQKIENLLKTKKYISQVMVVGDKRKYLTAIISIEKENYIQYFEELGLDKTCSIKDLSEQALVQKLIQENINETNKNLAKFETIKKFYICNEEFSIDNGLLTPSLKVKKKIVLERFKENIDAMYN
jgi:long-chain acyl-CoA synthetase